MTQTWKSPADLTAAPLGAKARHDEFAPDVAQAIADLRARHGIDSPSCQHAGNQPGEADRMALVDALPAVNRRGFLQLTGAAAVFSLAACAEKHPDTIVPFAEQPEGTVLGNAAWYASVVRDSGQPVSVLVKTYDGRPIKLEGNPDCPVGQGRADAATQAALLNLYDPDRIQDGAKVRSNGAFINTPWTDLDAAVGKALATGKVALLTGLVDGPARRALIDDLVAAFGGRLSHAVVEAYPRIDAAKAAQSSGLLGAPRYRLDQAEALVTFGSDLLAGGQTGLAELVGFGPFRSRRNAGGGTIFSVEATLSQTGTLADHRVRCADDALAHAAWGVAELVAQALESDIPPEAKAVLAQVRGGGDLSTKLDLKPIDGKPAIAAIADALLAIRRAGKASLVYVGGASRMGDTALHLAAAFLNGILRNVGTTVVAGPASELADLGEADALLAAIARGEFATVIVAGCNPVHVRPGADRALAVATTVVVLADRLDETARLASHVAPTLHALEDWGDAEPVRGVVALQQPAIRPLWDARGVEQSLIAFAAAAELASFAVPKAAGSVTAPAVTPMLTVVARTPAWQAEDHGVLAWRDYLRQVWLAKVRPQLNGLASEISFWNAALARGVVALGGDQPAVGSLKADAIGAALAGTFAAPATSGYRLVLSASRSLRDGAMANNPWLNELPDPVSKVTWDTYLAVSPADATREGWKDNDVLTLTVGAINVALPIVVQPGQHPGTLESFLGWGRAHAGQVASFCVTDGHSVDLFPLRTALRSGATVSVAKTGTTYQLANVQGHHDLEGRPHQFDQVLGEKPAEGHVGWATGSDGKPGGRLNVHGKTHAYLGHKWGMTVDLDLCTGCNACITACSAENNVPVVGRDEVRKAREMHWMRIDRYYSGDATAKLDVDVVQQPVMCQHCDNAPCEIVCPANATMHNDTGVNIMVYNRCIGTRYCSNNCPYKTRRFNWYEYSQLRAGPVKSGDSLDRLQRNLITTGNVVAKAELAQAPLQMLFNPEVTVRSKGVMEKCNFCVQRTRFIVQGEKTTGKAAKDGETTSACAQSCPSQAITFGDLNDPFAQVVQTATAGDHEHRAFLLMDEELNTRPAVTYLRKLRHRTAKPDGDAHHPAAEGTHS